MKKNRINYIKTLLTPQRKEYIYKKFAEHSVTKVGFDGFADNPVAFEARENEELIGTCVVQLFWGNLHIKYLIVEEKYRRKGIARSLMEHAFEYGIQKGCKFTFVETVSFQAPEFYQKIGFRTELQRNGYAANASLYYLSKDL
jgi:ribosomal protein S18 acetylase RimI-like enzyme